LPKPHPDLGEGGVSPFFRRDGDGFRRSPKQYRDRRCDRRSAAAVIGESIRDLVEMLLEATFNGSAVYGTKNGKNLSFSAK
jgi:hypothetical protein